jgi:hypothetical protein
MFEPFEALSGAREGSESTHASMCPRMAPYSIAEGNAENAARASARRSGRSRDPFRRDSLDLVRLGRHAAVRPTSANAETARERHDVCAVTAL